MTEEEKPFDKIKNGLKKSLLFDRHSQTFFL